MIVVTTWKSRPLSPEQTNRMMSAWGQLEADLASATHTERLGWYLYADGSGGITITRASDVEAATAYNLKVGLMLGEFLDIESKVALDLESAMPVITTAVSAMND